MRANARPVEPAPFALVAPGRHGPRLSAVNRRAEAEGLGPGMRLADARALLSTLAVGEADPRGDRRALERLALWCGRFTPWSARHGEDGLLLGIAGCAHLFGGEAALTDEIATRLEALGLEARAGLADTPGAAWALARFAPDGARLADPGSSRAALEPLPIEALRLTPGTASALRRLGLATIGALDALPRAPLARRFASREEGEAVLLRLDQALGRRDEPISPIAPPPVHLRRLDFPEPLLDGDGLRAALARLMAGLLTSLERRRQGARRLSLWCFRLDGSAARRQVETARASRDGDHLLRLFSERLDTVDPGFGIDAAVLHATRVEPLAGDQLALGDRGRTRDDVDRLVDRLAARLGGGSLMRLEAVARHLPEQAQRALPPGRNHGSVRAAFGSEGRCRPQRPFRLFERPEPVEVVAEVPAEPEHAPAPRLFIWRRVLRRVARAAGPERILPEWWAAGADDGARDYYRVEDSEGRRYWLYRAGRFRDGDARGLPRWYLHGLYG